MESLPAITQLHLARGQAARPNCARVTADGARPRPHDPELGTTAFQEPQQLHSAPAVMISRGHPVPGPLTIPEPSQQPGTRKVLSSSRRQLWSFAGCAALQMAPPPQARAQAASGPPNQAGCSRNPNGGPRSAVQHSALMRPAQTPWQEMMQRIKAFRDKSHVLPPPPSSYKRHELPQNHTVTGTCVVRASILFV